MKKEVYQLIMILIVFVNIGLFGVSAYYHISPSIIMLTLFGCFSNIMVLYRITRNQ